MQLGSLNSESHNTAALGDEEHSRTRWLDGRHGGGFAVVAGWLQTLTKEEMKGDEDKLLFWESDMFTLSRVTRLG